LCALSDSVYSVRFLMASPTTPATPALPAQLPVQR
jgi:hypothetical protein